MVNIDIAPSHLQYRLIEIEEELKAELSDKSVVYHLGDTAINFMIKELFDEFSLFFTVYEEEIQQIKTEILNGYDERIDKAIHNYTELLPNNKLRDMFVKELREFGESISHVEVFNKYFGIRLHQIPYHLEGSEAILKAFLAKSLQ